MRSKRFISLAVMTAALALVVSSCGFVVRAYSFTNTNLTSPPGDVCTPDSCTNLRLQMRKLINAFGDFEDVGHPFVVLGLTDGIAPRFGPRWTDQNGAFFNDHTATRDDGLRAVAKQDGECSIPGTGGDLEDMAGDFDSFQVYRTTAEVDTADGDADDPIFFKPGLKLSDLELDPGAETALTILAVAGIWFDEEGGGTEGEVDPGEILCLSSVFTTVVYTQADSPMA